MTKHIPEEPKFIQDATATQKWLAGIAVSMFFVVWITGWGFVAEFFKGTSDKTDFTLALTYLRFTIALIAIGITSIVGYPQIRKMLSWIYDSWTVSKDILESIKNKDKEK